MFSIWPKGWHGAAGLSGRHSRRRSSPASLTRRTNAAIARALSRFAPGTYTTEPFVHDYWEEVFLVAGDLIVGNDRQGNGGEKFQNYTYAVRPPGVYHGPFKSDLGCLLLETHYFAEA